MFVLFVYICIYRIFFEIQVKPTFVSYTLLSTVTRKHMMRTVWSFWQWNKMDANQNWVEESISADSQPAEMSIILWNKALGIDV